MSFSSVSIFDFEELNFSWEYALTSIVKLKILSWEKIICQFFDRLQLIPIWKKKIAPNAGNKSAKYSKFSCSK